MLSSKVIRQRAMIGAATVIKPRHGANSRFVSIWPNPDEGDAEAMLQRTTSSQLYRVVLRLDRVTRDDVNSQFWMRAGFCSGNFYVCSHLIYIYVVVINMNYVPKKHMNINY
eukprot:6486492-Amphidinium_carterae.1